MAIANFKTLERCIDCTAEISEGGCTWLHEPYITALFGIRLVVQMVSRLFGNQCLAMFQIGVSLTRYWLRYDLEH